jgi:hypothetical protein
MGLLRDVALLPSPASATMTSDATSSPAMSRHRSARIFPDASNISAPNELTRANADWIAGDVHHRNVLLGAVQGRDSVASGEVPTRAAIARRHGLSRARDSNRKPAVNGRRLFD